MHDLHMLPKVRDSWSYLYVEHCRIDQEDKAIALHDANGKTPVPCASLTLLMVGPGTTVTHAAIRTLAETGCTVLWGWRAKECAAMPRVSARRARLPIFSVKCVCGRCLTCTCVWCGACMKYVSLSRSILTLRFSKSVAKKGIRVREAYAQASRAYGVEWHGRAYNRQDWAQSYL